MKSVINAYLKMYEQKPVQLDETTLDDYQKDKIDRIADQYFEESGIAINTKKKITDALGHKKFTAFELNDSQSSEPDSDVVEHLADHGYDIHDYKKGIATKKVVVGDPSRGIPHREKTVQESIGSILTRTKAPKHVMDAFLHDPVRAVSGTPTKAKHVVITQTPYGVGAMSTGTGWTSCMHLDTGSNSHYISQDIRHGTHVAYLVNHDDHEGLNFGEPSKPLARIALKPFHSEDGDTIFRPEERIYGSQHHAFEKAVAKWAVDNYPAKNGIDYEKNANVYDDTGKTIYRTESIEDVKNRIDNGRPVVNHKGQMLDHHVIDGALAHINTLENWQKSNALHSMLSVGNMNQRHIIALHKAASSLEDPNNHLLKQMALHHGDKFTTKMHQEYIDNGIKDYPPSLLRSAKLPESVIDTLPVSKLPDVKRSKIKDHHIDRVIDAYANNESGSAYTLRDMSWGMKSHHLKRLIDMDKVLHDFSSVSIISDHPNLTRDGFGHLMSNMRNTKSRYLSIPFQTSRYAKYEDVEKYADNSQQIDSHIHAMTQNPHISDEDAKEVAKGIVDIFEKPIQSIYKGTALSDKVGKHIDYNRTAMLSNADILSFKNPDHSYNHIKKMNDVLHDKYDNDDDEFEDYRDIYEDAIRNHISDHIENGDGEVINHGHLAKLHEITSNHRRGFDLDKIERKVHRMMDHNGMLY